MRLFSKKNSTHATKNTGNTPTPQSAGAGVLAEVALGSIRDGVIMTDKAGVVQYINPAAVAMLGTGSDASIIGLDYGLFMKLESKEGRELPDNENHLFRAMQSGQPLENYQCCLAISGKRIPIAVTMQPDQSGNVRIITFRNITKELAEESERTEFISTASHEMRTPVATIDGYISLALNPQTATIDDRARGYLDAAAKASKHLGKLFHDLLDVTKLDDGRIRPNFVPVEMMGTVKQIADGHAVRAREAGLNFQFGSSSPSPLAGSHKLEQVIYASVDLDFLREILDNLIDNAIKYTKKGGSIYVGVLGDGDRALINVTDTGVGISSSDLQHIFQKFYRADNSDTREVGGTGLGLYLVKQRAEAMGGRVWAESGFGEGSTFYVSLPRITAEEYEKRMIAVRNAAMVKPTASPPPAPPKAPISSPNPNPAIQTNQGVTK